MPLNTEVIISINFGIATKNTITPMVISIISDGAFIAEFNFPPPYFKAPNNNPAGIVANGLFAAINDTAIPSKPYP